MNMNHLNPSQLARFGRFLSGCNRLVAATETFTETRPFFADFFSQLLAAQAAKLGGEGRNRTDEYSFCRAVPYHLATPPPHSSSYRFPLNASSLFTAAFSCVAQAAPVLPEVFGADYPNRRDDARDQFRRGDVKSRVARAAAGIGHPHVNHFRAPAPGAPGAQDFALGALLNRNVQPATQVPVYGRKRDGDIKWDAVPMGQHRLGVGADFVGHFPGAPKGAVAADNNKVYLAPLHQVAGGVVGDDLMGDLLVRQFPRRQRGALAAGARFVAERRGICGRLFGRRKAARSRCRHPRRPATRRCNGSGRGRSGG